MRKKFRKTINIILAVAMIASLLPMLGGVASAQVDLARSGVYTLAEGNIARAGTAIAQYTNGYQPDDAAIRVNNGAAGGATHANSWNSFGYLGTFPFPTVWIDIRWDEIYTIDSMRVMWSYDGTGSSSGVQLPSSAVVQYWNGTAYVSVTNMTNPAGAPVVSVGILGSGTNEENNIWNGVRFDPVATDRLRLLITQRRTSATTAAGGAGISEWEIFGAQDPLDAALAWVRGQLSLANLVADVSLPTTHTIGANTFTYAYESSNPAVFGNDGKITRPAIEQPDATGTLAVTASNAGGSKSETLNWSVRALMSDQQAIDLDYAWLTLSGINNATASLNLPAVGPEGSVITWDAGGSAYLWDDGTVLRPPQGSDNEAATLTATLSFGSVVREKPFTVTIQAYPTGGKSIVDYDPIIVEQPFGTAPKLPNYVMVDYSDGTSGQRMVMWGRSSVSNQTTDFNRAVGVNYDITGTVLGDPSNNNAGFQVVANVTVVPPAAYDDVPSPVPLATPLPWNRVVIDNDPNGQENRLTQNRNGGITWILNTNVSSHLFNFRDNAGLSTSGYTSPGGWDSNTGKLKGHGHGHYFSGLALSFASGSTQAQQNQLFERMERVTRELRIYQEMTYVTGAQWEGNESGYREAKDRYSTRAQVSGMGNMLLGNASKDPTLFGAGYVHAIVPESLILNERYAPYNGTWGQYGVWAPYYSVHKILQGLVDIHDVLNGMPGSFTFTSAGAGPNAPAAGTSVTYQEVADRALLTATEMGLWIWNRLYHLTEPGQCNGSEAVHSCGTGTNQVGFRDCMFGPYIKGEAGGVAEPIARMAQILEKRGDIFAGMPNVQQYADKAAKLAECATFFDMNYAESDSGSLPYMKALSQNRDSMRTLHANSHVPNMVGTLWNFRNTGDPKYWHMSENFLDFTIGRYAYSPGGVTGNASNDEKYIGAYNQTQGVINAMDKIMETCATHNQIKLARDLFAHRPDDAKYMDFVERMLFNQIVGSIVPGSTTCQITYGYRIGLNQARSRGAAGTVGGTCCTGTGTENPIRMQDATYYESADGKTFYVNLYMPTTATWDAQNIIIRQECVFPAQSSRFTFTPNVGGQTGEFEMMFRVPYWATGDFNIRLNGSPINGGVFEPSSYVSTGVRAWEAGDVIQVDMPYDFHFWFSPQKRSGSNNWFGSVMLGPLVMVGTGVTTYNNPLEVDSFLSTGAGTNITITPSTTQTTSVTTRNVPIITARINNVDRTYYPTYWVPNNSLTHTHYIDLAYSDSGGLVDRNSLFEKLTEAWGFMSGNYTAPSRANLQTAISAAVVVYQNNSATETQLNARITALNVAIAALEGEGDLNLAQLEAAIAAAEVFAEADYTWDSYAALQTALGNAKSALAQGKLEPPAIGQPAVDQQVNALNAAVNALVARSSLNRAALEDALSDAALRVNPLNDLDKYEWEEHVYVNYTVTTWNAFVAARDYAQDVYDNVGKVFNQSEITAAARALNEAALELLSNPLCGVERDSLRVAVAAAKVIYEAARASGKYTEESLAALLEMIVYAEEDRLTYASLTYYERDGTIGDLQRAIDALAGWEPVTTFRLDMNAITRVARNGELPLEISVNKGAIIDMANVTFSVSNTAMAVIEIGADGAMVKTLNRAGTVTLTATYTQEATDTQAARTLRHSVTLMIT